MILWILSFILLLCVINRLCYHSSYAKKLLQIPSPKVYFLFGHAPHILLTPVKLFYLGRYMAAKFKNINAFYSFTLGAVNIYNPEDVEVVVSNMKYHEKSDLYKFLKPWLQEGLLLSNGSKWQHRRKILTPAFHFNVLQKYYVAVEENNQRLIEKLDTTNGERVDMVPMLSDYTLDVICESAMGTPLSGGSTDAGKSYKEAIYSLGTLLVHRFVHIYLYPDIFFKISSVGRKQGRCLSTVHNFTKNVIEKRKKMLEKERGGVNELKNSQDNENNQHTPKKKRNVAMLDLLLAAEKAGEIDTAGIQEEVDTFMFEGHDTTVTGLVYCLLSIANAPEVQERVVEEMNNIFGDDSRAATMDDLTAMRYLECCIKESLRLYPPVPFISRKLPVDTVLSGYTVPAGVFCHIHIYDLHRQERLYKNPLKFDPDRFLPENSIGRHTYAYIPFSAGPRNCIGQKFAMIEMKSALSAILRNYQLIPVTRHTDLRFTADLILRNSEPVYVKFVKRKQ